MSEGPAPEEGGCGPAHSRVGRGSARLGATMQPGPRETTMSRTLRRRSRTARVPPAALALALLMGTAAQAGAAEAVVVASTAPGYAQGQVVADGAVVKLPDGAGALFLF